MVEEMASAEEDDTMTSGDKFKSIVAGVLFTGAFIGLIAFMAVIGVQDPSGTTPQIPTVTETGGEAETCLIVNQLTTGKTTEICIEETRVAGIRLIISERLDTLEEEVTTVLQMDINVTAKPTIEFLGSNITVDEATFNSLRAVQAYLAASATGEGSDRSWRLSVIDGFISQILSIALLFQNLTSSQDSIFESLDPSKLDEILFPSAG